jgi:hypothetical protein
MPSRFQHLLAALLLAALPAGGRPAFGAELTTTVSPQLVSTAVFRGQLRGGAALQTVLESSGGDLGGGLWTSLPLESAGTFAPGTEADLYLFGTRSLGAGLSLVPGATLYTYPRAERSAGFRRATFEPSLALNATVGGVKFTPKAYHDFTLAATTLELAAACAFALPSLGTELDWAVTAGTYLRRDDGAGFAATTRAWGNYWHAGVTVPYQISAHTRLLVGWTYAAGTGASVKIAGGGRRPDPRAASRGFVSLGFSSTF